MTFSARTYVGELYQITTFDGQVFDMSDYSTRAVLTTPGSMGMPPIEYITRKPYKQPGEVELNYRLNVRDFTVLFATNGCSRAAYWQARTDLINFCRPNRGGPLTFTVIMEDNTRRSIVARSYSPTFPEQSVEEWREWGFTEQLALHALNPTWFDSTINTLSIGNGELDELAFDITFDDEHIFFEDISFFGLATITYTGTWYSQPIITINGPFTSALIYHVELNNFIQFLLAVPAGSSLVIDLESNPPSVTVNGIDRFGYLAANSDISQFRIEVDPLIPGGVNHIGFTLVDNLPTTSASLTYKTRYIGI